VASNGKELGGGSEQRGRASGRESKSEKEEDSSTRPHAMIRSMARRAAVVRVVWRQLSGGKWCSHDRTLMSEGTCAWSVQTDVNCSTGPGPNLMYSLFPNISKPAEH
jgi:thymidylate kinase